MTSSRLSLTGLGIIVAAVALAVLVTPALALLGLIGLALCWAAPNASGTVNAYTYHGAGHEDFRGAGANDRRRGL